MGNGELNTGGYPCNGLASHSGGGGVKTPLVTSCYRNRDKHQPDGPQLAHTQALPLPRYIKEPDIWADFDSESSETPPYDHLINRATS